MAESSPKTGIPLHATWWLQLVLAAIIALGSMFGGAMLVVEPGGSLIGMDTAVLTGTPFSDFTLPGWILIVILGFGHAVIFVLTLLGSKTAARAAMIMGIALVIWILVQVGMIGYQIALQPLFGILGVIEAVNGYRRRRS